MTLEQWNKRLRKMNTDDEEFRASIEEATDVIGPFAGAVLDAILRMQYNMDPNKAPRRYREKKEGR